MRGSLRFQAVSRTYVPDFIVLVDDGHGAEDLLHLVVEIKGFRREDAKEKADTMQTDFAAKVEAEFGRLVDGVVVAHGAAA